MISYFISFFSKSIVNGANGVLVNARCHVGEELGLILEIKLLKKITVDHVTQWEIKEKNLATLKIAHVLNKN